MIAHKGETSPKERREKREKEKERGKGPCWTACTRPSTRGCFIQSGKFPQSRSGTLVFSRYHIASPDVPCSLRSRLCQDLGNSEGGALVSLSLLLLLFLFIFWRPKQAYGNFFFPLCSCFLSQEHPTLLITSVTPQIKQLMESHESAESSRWVVDLSEAPQSLNFLMELLSPDICFFLCCHKTPKHAIYKSGGTKTEFVFVGVWTCKLPGHPVNHMQSSSFCFWSASPKSLHTRGS